MLGVVGTVGGGPPCVRFMSPGRPCAVFLDLRKSVMGTDVLRMGRGQCHVAATLPPASPPQSGLREIPLQPPQT